MIKLIKKIYNLFCCHSTKKSVVKNQIRQQIKELKNQIPNTQKQNEAEVIFRKIESISQFQSAKTILIYWSTPDELATHDFVEKWSDKKEILLPVVVGKEIEMKRYAPKQKMKQGSFGIFEPDTSQKYTGIIDLVIVPGIAFDLKKNRLGRGKGYYDRFFNQIKAEKWGIGFDCQLFPSIPINKDDVKMDKIITSNSIID